MRSGLVLTYHRVAELPSDPFGLAVTPARFSEHLDLFRRTCRPMPLRELVRRARAGRLPKRSLALTFDDGYADNLHTAKPLLERFDIPAAVFVTTGYLDGQREFWWDELERVILLSRRLPRQLRLRVGRLLHEHSRRRGGPDARSRLYHELWAFLSSLPGGWREPALRRILRWSGSAREVRATHRQLTSGEVAALAEGGLVEIGAHTVTHPLLHGLSPLRQHWEIAGSRDTLADILGRPVTLFSYPHGSYAEVTLRILRETGFSVACTTAPALVGPGTDPLRVPRLTAWGWSEDELARHLDGWFTP